MTQVNVKKWETKDGWVKIKKKKKKKRRKTHHIEHSSEFLLEPNRGVFEAREGMGRVLLDPHSGQMGSLQVRQKRVIS